MIGGIVIPGEILNRRDLSATDKVIHTVMAQQSYINTIPKLSTHLSVSESTVRRSLKKLKSLELIS